MNDDFQNEIKHNDSRGPNLFRPVRCGAPQSSGRCRAMIPFLRNKCTIVVPILTLFFWSLPSKSEQTWSIAAVIVGDRRITVSHILFAVYLIISGKYHHSICVSCILYQVIDWIMPEFSSNFFSFAYLLSLLMKQLSTAFSGRQGRPTNKGLPKGKVDRRCQDSNVLTSRPNSTTLFV